MKAAAGISRASGFAAGPAAAGAAAAGAGAAGAAASAAGGAAGRRRRGGRRLEVREGSGVRGVLDLDQDRRADGNLGALGLQEPRDDALVLGRKIDRRLVGLDLADRVALAEAPPFLDVPLLDRADLHRRRQRGEAHDLVRRVRERARGEAVWPARALREGPRGGLGRWVPAASARAGRCATARAHGLRRARILYE